MIEAGARGLVWTRATLDAFLANPPGALSGTEMGPPGLPDVDERRDVIDYLEQASGGRTSPTGRSPLSHRRHGLVRKKAVWPPAR